MNKPNAYIAALRKEYISEPLNLDDTEKDPLVMFDKWFNEATETLVTEPNAMTLSTCTKDGWPSGRFVLLKEFDEKGFVFYTNYKSRKSDDLNKNPNAALTFYWPELERQVRIEGSVKKVPTKMSDEYFATRPFDSQIGALASNQSEEVSDRAILEKRFDRLMEKYKKGKVPRPKTWGGFRVVPTTIEFWQGRNSRMHERIIFRHVKGKKWDKLLLAP